MSTIYTSMSLKISRYFEFTFSIKLNIPIHYEKSESELYFY